MNKERRVLPVRKKERMEKRNGPYQTKKGGYSKVKKRKLFVPGRAKEGGRFPQARLLYMARETLRA